MFHVSRLPTSLKGFGCLSFLGEKTIIMRSKWIFFSTKQSSLSLPHYFPSPFPLPLTIPVLFPFPSLPFPIPSPIPSQCLSLKVIIFAKTGLYLQSLAVLFAVPCSPYSPMAFGGKKITGNYGVFHIPPSDLALICPHKPIFPRETYVRRKQWGNGLPSPARRTQGSNMKLYQLQKQPEIIVSHCLKHLKEK